MPEGLHLGRGGDIAVLILVLVADIDEGGGGGGGFPLPPAISPRRWTTRR